MNEYTYKQLKDKQQTEINKFPMGAAFNDKQFYEMMQKWGLTVNDTDKIVSICGGCFIRKSDKAAFDEMLERHRREIKDAVAADTTGDGFIYGMFLYELANHEYCITCNLTDTLCALGLTVDEINEDERLLHGFKKACKSYMRSIKDIKE